MGYLAFRLNPYPVSTAGQCNEKPSQNLHHYRWVAKISDQQKKPCQPERQENMKHVSVILILILEYGCLLPERPKGVKDEVKRPEGPTTWSRGPEGP